MGKVGSGQIEEQLPHVLAYSHEALNYVKFYAEF